VVEIWWEEVRVSGGIGKGGKGYNLSKELMMLTS